MRMFTLPHSTDSRWTEELREGKPIDIHEESRSDEKDDVPEKAMPAKKKKIKITLRNF